MPSICQSSSPEKRRAVRQKCRKMKSRKTKADLLKEIDALHRRVEELENAEDSFRERERRLLEIIDFFPDATMIIDRNGKVIAWNRSIEIMTGIKAEEIIGRGNYEYAIPFYGGRRPILVDIALHPDASLEKRYTTIERQGEILFGESYTPFLRKSEGVHLSATASVLRDLKGDTIGAIECIRDNTERKKLEEDLLRSEKRYRDLVDNSPVGVYQTHIDGKIFFANQFFADMIEIKSPDELMSLNMIDFYLRKEDRREFIAILKTEGILRNHDIDFVTGAGNIRHVLISAVLDYDLISGTVVDITERKQIEKSLKNSERTFRDLFDNSPDPCWIIEGEVFTDCNNAAVLAHGYRNKSELLGKRPWQLAPERQPGGELSIEKGKRMLAEAKAKGIHRFEWEKCRADGGTYTVDTILATTMIHGKEVFYCTWRDISESKRAEEERRQLERQLIHAQKMEAIGMLAGGVAHDFNNILMSIQGYAGLVLMETAPDNPSYPKLKIIEEQVKSGATLTRQLLGIARSGVYDVKPTNMNDLLEKSSGMFGRTKKEININKYLQDNIWIVRIDQGQINQVLLNLFINAWQAMPEGGDLFLETQNVHLDESVVAAYNINPGSYVRISVTDTGIGMDEETMEQIFNPFFTTKKADRGTGLGLASAYGIIRNHGGYITVRSMPGRGSTFNIFLPASVAEPEDASASGPVMEKIPGNETILVVDDEINIATMMKDILTSLGYRVFLAGSGQEAISIYMEKKKDIDLIIMDMIMPGISGEKAFMYLRDINPDVKVVVSSGYSIDSQYQQILKEGCRGFLQKPFNIEELSRKIREVLDSNVL